VPQLDDLTPSARDAIVKVRSREDLNPEVGAKGKTCRAWADGLADYPRSNLDTIQS
jgi:hypothetical protein